MLVLIPVVIGVQIGVFEIASVISKTESTYFLDHEMRIWSPCRCAFTDQVPEDAVIGVKVDPGMTGNPRQLMAMLPLSPLRMGCSTAL